MFAETDITVPNPNHNSFSDFSVVSNGNCVGPGLLSLFVGAKWALLSFVLDQSHLGNKLIDTNPDNITLVS